MQRRVHLFLLAALALAPAMRGRAEEFPTDGRALASSIDEQIEKKMAACKIPGAAVSIVKDGSPLLAKGYGYANLERRIPVAADRTRFCLGSITKVFTATAALQLVERGELDLGADVNRYLKNARLPETYPAPITLAHLLTHTSGLDHTVIGIGAFVAAEALPLERHLLLHPAARVMPPGELSVYSNRNATWAGYLVEVVSGTPYRQYVERNVLLPLGMLHSGFTPPPDPEAELAVGYDLVDGRAQAWPYPHLNDVPAGGIWSTAVDMQRFMLAHLQGGRLGDVRILEEETANRMHRPQYSFHPGIPGMSYGLMEDVRGGRRAWMHEGLIAGFFSLIVLVPELNLGVFAATNGGSEDCDLVYGISSSLLDAFFPRERPPPEPRNLPGAEIRARALEGTYRAVDISLATFEAVTVPLGMAQEAEVRAGAAGELLVDGHRYFEVEPSLYERADREGRIAFRTSAAGRGEAMARGVIAYRRVPWQASALLHRMILGSSLFLLGATLVAWPAGALLQRFRGRPSPRVEADRAALWLGRAAAALPFLFFGGLALGASGPLGPWILTTTPPWLKALLTIPLAMTLAVPAMAALALKLWRTREASLGSRLRATSIALAGAGFLFFCASWNLLGLRF